MPYRWPTDTDFVPWELDVLDRRCGACGRGMHICDHRFRHLHTLLYFPRFATLSSGQAE
jgi:hypothetical protein